MLAKCCFNSRDFITAGSEYERLATLIQLGSRKRELITTERRNFYIDHAILCCEYLNQDIKTTDVHRQRARLQLEVKNALIERDNRTCDP
jgi:hypothetical protein